MQCSNLACDLRFPLDLGQHAGRFCPRCGSALQDAGRRESQFMAAPASTAGWEVAAILDNVRSAQNVGSIFRTCDGAGIARVYLCGITPTPADNPAIGKTALGAESRIPWEYYASALTLLRRLKEENVHILALESTPSALSLFDEAPAPIVGSRIALVAGNEPAGVDPAVLNIADSIVRLPMLGEKRSLNVAVAFGIAAYQLQFGNQR